MFGTILFSIGMFIVNLWFPGQSSSPFLQRSVDASSFTFSQNILFIGRIGPGLPVHLKIPKINVDAAIEHVGLAPDGSIGVPQGPANTAWFSLGPRPGALGSAVIDGHFDWTRSTPAVFDSLSELTPGDTVYVEDDAGVTAAFIVRELRTYARDEDSTSVLTSYDGKAHLNLITCTGVWSEAKQSYSDRLVVFTDALISTHY